MTPRWRGALKYGLLLVVVLLAYLPALRNGFVWDDDAHLTAPALRSVEGLRRIWTEPGATQQYYPLLHSAFWVEHRVFGDSPFGYHLTNLLLHALAACLFLLLLERLSVPGALIASVLFALHPVQAESVAWISEQKNTLSLVFYLAAALAYFRFDATHTRRAYFLALGWFACALLTKTVTATLPAALLVVIWWRRGRLSWRRDVLPLLPWFVLGALAGLFTVTVEHDLIGAGGSAIHLAPLQRVVLAGRALWFYVGKLAWPASLAFIYPQWTLDPTSLPQWVPALIWIVVGVVVWRARSHARGPLAAYLLFTGSLFPALGFFNLYPFRYSFVADHFQYLAGLSVFAVAGVLLVRAITGPWVVGVAAAAFATLTWHQALQYRDASTLYRATLATNPDCWMAYNNLGKELMSTSDRREDSIGLFHRALALRPDYFEARNNLGLALTQAARPAEAVPQLRRAVAIAPGSYQAHNNLGIALASSGRAADALAEFRVAAALNSTLPNIQENWARALLLLGRNAEANDHFAIARRLRAASPTSR
jgi:protein O-mannosyl-transferase